MSNVDRFLKAQNSSYAGLSFCSRRIACGSKSGHWMWYVFPQIEGLGSSGPANAFAIGGEEEAAEFLRNPELRSRLFTITEVVAKQLSVGRATSFERLMGSHIDAKKVVSSLTLLRARCKETSPS